MLIRENVSLQQYNTFGIDIKADKLAAVSQESDIAEILQQSGYGNQSLLILGGGSNILFSGDFRGLVVKNDIYGRELIKQDEDYVWLRLGAGENWHQCVLWAIKHGWAGIENLSLIPGTVGAAPMQNIGAYGVELCSVFESLEVIELNSGKFKEFKTEDCDFGYRYSVFKGPLKGRYIITRVVLRLRKTPVFNISYGAVSKTLKEMGVAQLTIKDISNAVIKIRQSKLPDPAKIGNAGSFFKNPVVEHDIFNILKTEYTNMPHYHTEDGLVKIPAGWLIEQCRWKGYRRGEIGVHKNQALVLVNYGGGRGSDLVNLSQEIRDSVTAKFGIELTPEVNII